MHIFNSVLLTFLLSASSVAAQGILATTLEKVAASSVYIWAGDSLKEIFHDDGGVIHNSEIAISPNGRLVGAVIHGRELKTDSLGNLFHDSMLSLFDVNGKVTLLIPDVIRFAWSPESDRIAFVKGKGDGESYRIIPRRLCVIEIKTQGVTTFSSGPYEDIAWASFDSMIYYTNYSEVFRVDPKNGEQSSTQYKGIYFSPNGEFYYNPNYGGLSGVYEREGNVEVTPQRFRENPRTNLYRWLQRGSTIVIGNLFGEKEVIDLPSLRLRATIAGEYLGYAADTQEFITVEYADAFPKGRITRLPDAGSR